MIIGQTLHATGNSTTVKALYSPWFERGGDAGEFACEIIYQTDTTNVDIGIKIETKNMEETDADADPPTSGGTMTEDSGWMKSSASGFKELVRFEYKVWYKGSGTISDFVILRMLFPQWLPN